MSQLEPFFGIRSTDKWLGVVVVVVVVAIAVSRVMDFDCKTVII